jgi:hypothetical protein
VSPVTSTGTGMVRWPGRTVASQDRISKVSWSLRNSRTTPPPRPETRTGTSYVTEPESPSATWRFPMSSRGRLVVPGSGLPGRQPHASSSQAWPDAVRGVNSSAATRPVTPRSGTRTS